MAIELHPIPLPESADANRLKDFGREVRGLDPSTATPEEFQELENALYTFDALLFRNLDLSPQQQYELTKRFDPSATTYAHGITKMQNIKSSILTGYLNSIPDVPQVQLIGHGNLTNHHGVPEVTLKHGHHSTFHRTLIPPEEEESPADGVTPTRFFRWHMDAALYDLNPPKVTTLYGVRVPQGPKQVVRYDDGSGDTLPVPLGTTAFVSGKTMFDILPPELKSLAVRAKAKYAPRPFVWIKDAKALSTGLGIVNEGLEKDLEELENWDEDKRKTYPFVWKNPITGAFHFMVHPCAISEVFIDSLPVGMTKLEGQLYPEGAHLTDLKEVRSLLYEMQRPGIAPSLVYPHDWSEKDLMIFHNRGVMHSVVGLFKKDQLRVFHQCNLSALDEPKGPSEEDKLRELMESHVASVE